MKEISIPRENMPAAPHRFFESIQIANSLLRQNKGRATPEIALLLAEAESLLLRQENPSADVLRHLADLRISAAEDL